MACSHPGGREGSVCSPLAFLWGTNSRLGCVALVGLYGLLVGLFGLGLVASTEPRLLGTATVQQAWRSERAELEARLLVTEQLVAGRSGLATAHLDSLAPSSEDPGMNPAAFSWFALIYDDLRQPMPAPSIVAIGTAVANSSSWHAVPQQAPRLAGDFSCDCMFRGEREGGYTRQVGPSVDTAIMTTVLSTNRVDSRSFSSRRCAFRRTHTSTDPIRLLCIRLALPLNLFLPSRFAPGTKLMVGVSPRASWPAGVFLRDCTFWDCKGGVLIINRQQVGPLVNTPATTTATGINHVEPSRARSLRNLLVSGNECGRVFPAGVGPGSPSRDAANWLPSRFSLSVETRRRYGWLRMMVFPGARLFPSPNLVPFGRVAARERQGALSRRAW